MTVGDGVGGFEFLVVVKYSVRIALSGFLLLLMSGKYLRWISFQDRLHSDLFRRPGIAAGFLKPGTTLWNSQDCWKCPAF